MANPNEIDKRVCPICAAWMEVLDEVYGNKFVSGTYKCELCGILKVSSKISRQPLTVVPSCPFHGLKPVIPIDSSLVMDDAAEYRCTTCGMTITRDPERRRLAFIDATGQVMTYGEVERVREGL
jgi:predicted RNA-binding Zn-ribbon protein involved in translation (DUF1610 family)